MANGASGSAILGNPTLEGFGGINRVSEMSNVEIVEEMQNMIMAQRACEINSKVIQTSDEMSSPATQEVARYFSAHPDSNNRRRRRKAILKYLAAHYAAPDAECL
jgi:hypothetical protein